jgi:hypothetical protein
MTTNYIDVAFHGSAFPATYTVPGALRAIGVTTTTNMLAASIMADLEDDEINGTFTALGNDITIPIGFNPTKIEVWNWTDGIKVEWAYGAPATKTIKTITNAATVVGAGGGTVPADELEDANSLIVVTTSDGTPGSNASVSFAAALAVNAKVLSFRIEG